MCKGIDIGLVERALQSICQQDQAITNAHFSGEVLNEELAGYCYAAHERLRDICEALGLYLALTHKGDLVAALTDYQKAQNADIPF